MDVTYTDQEFFSKWVPRYINDEPGRILNAEQGGWEPVGLDEVVGGDQMVKDGQSTGLDSGIWRIANRGRDGSPVVWAKLMKIRKDWYDEDQALKEERNRLVDQAVRAGKAGGADISNKYGDVKLDT